MILKYVKPLGYIYPKSKMLCSISFNIYRRVYCLFKNTFYYVDDVLQYQMAFFLNSEDTDMENT